jgi:hypothetical protein
MIMWSVHVYFSACDDLSLELASTCQRVSRLVMCGLVMCGRALSAIVRSRAASARVIAETMDAVGADRWVTNSAKPSCDAWDGNRIGTQEPIELDAHAQLARVRTTLDDRQSMSI